MLRINKDGTIPTDNPFYTQTTGRNRAIWALGLRNPFTIDVQPGTGRIFINDVGASTWEEINVGSRGANYGWPATEGPTSDSRFRSPLFAYGHGNSSTTGCAIAGGAFYNPGTQQFPNEYVGDYFFADLCSGWIRRLDPATRTVTGFATGINVPVDVKVRPGTGGALWYLARGSGAVYRVRYTGSTTTGSASTGVTSSITLSTATALVTSNSVQLSFTGLLDASTATDPTHYRVQVNGTAVAVESAAYDMSTNTVTLGLPQGALKSGDQVVVEWSDLSDTRGNRLSGQSGTLIAQ
jgi:hypothetical protein